MSKRVQEKRVQEKQAARVVREQLARERRRTRTLWITFSAVALLVIAGLVGWSVYRTQKPAAFASPAGVVDVGGEKAGLLAADEGGTVTVEVYLDFICPACKQFEATTTATLNQLLAEKKIKLIWHPLGFLDAQSNPPGYSTRAASASGCAADGGKLKAYGEALFTIQPPEGGPGFNDDQLIEIGGSVGLNAPSFAQCVRAVRYQDWINHVNDQAAKRGVNQTPTIYVGGKLLQNPTPASLTAAVASAT